MGKPIQKVSAYLSKLVEAEYTITPQISGVINYFVDSWIAKNEEYATKNARPRPWEPPDPLSHIKELWLGCELHAAVTLNRTYPSFARTLNAYAFSKLFSGPTSTYDVVPFLDGYKWKDLLKNSFYCRIQSEQLHISLTEWVTLPVFGNFFVKHRTNGTHLYVTLDLGYESPGCRISVMCPPGHQKDVEQFFADMDHSIVANDIYYKKCMTFVRGSLDFMEVKPNSWNDIVLKESIKRRIQDNTVAVLENSEVLSSIGMCPNRNTLICSPPGMAKTTIFRAITTDVYGKMSVIWCTGKSIEHSEHITSLFQAARSLAPCIVFAEDLDLNSGDRSGPGDTRILNELLACLDGAQENSGVVIMASTNDIASMDEAAVRPGRFDTKIEIPLPDESERLAIIGIFLTSYHAKFDKSVTQEVVNNTVNLLDGLSGAHLREFSKTVVLRAVAEGRCFNGIVTIMTDDLVSASEQTLENFKLIQKNKKHHQLSSP